MTSEVINGYVLTKPAAPYQYTRLCNDKNCQSTRCYKNKNPMKQVKSVYNDKNCQAIHCVYIQTAMKSNDMQSVTKSSIMLLPKPAMEQSDPEDKNCQATRCFSFKSKCPVRLVCDDKNCQSAKHMCYDKECHVKSESEGPHFICGQQWKQVICSHCTVCI